VKHYHQVLDALRQRGLEPIVTVSHWVYPAWLDAPDAAGKRGWESERMQTALATHAAWLAKEFGPQVKWWLTLNEPNTMGPAAFVVGMYPPAKHDLLAYRQVMQHQIAAHKLAYDAIHANDADAQVSLCPIAINYPDTRGPGTEGIDPHLYLDEREIYDQVAPHHADYVAFNYFHSLRLHDYVKVSKSWTWPIYPRGIYEVSKDLYNRYHKPLMITENGMATFKGQPRSDKWTREAFLVQHVGWLQKAMAEGVPVLGYMHWSIADNYEWGSHDPRFGLFSVDPDDLALKRVRTTAADVYETIVRAGGVSPRQLTQFPAP
jgi:beta-glucosidase